MIRPCALSFAVERLEKIGEYLKNWDGLLSVVVYAKTLSELELIYEFRKHFLLVNTAEDAMRVRIHAVAKCVELKDRLVVFPINLLRRRCMQIAATPVVVFLDAGSSAPTCSLQAVARRLPVNPDACWNP